MHILLVCPEPLLGVTGGIGTYTREIAILLREADIKVSILTRDPKIEETRFFAAAGIEIYKISHNYMIPHNVFPTQLQESYFIWKTISELSKETTFTLIEFPDYEAPGYYTFQAKTAGHQLPILITRLHSPQFMLHDDNLVSSYDLSTMRLRAAEYESIKLSDEIIYAAPAMLKRVQSYYPKLEQFPTAIQIAHPIPMVQNQNSPEIKTMSSKIKIGCIGRQEYRKGWDLIFRNGIINWDDFEFHFFGNDTVTSNGMSCRDFIKTFVPQDHVDGIFFHGYLTPEELVQRTDLMNAFIFPSRFENFPNALLEVLPSGKPCLVSEHGGMPYITKGSEQSKVFDPYQEFNLDHLRNSPIKVDMSNSLAINIPKGYLSLMAREVNNEKVPGKVSVVIPLGPDDSYLMEAIECCLPESNISEILVVGNNRKKIPAVLENNYDSKIKYFQTNLDGPNAARIYGIQIASNDYIQFLDADDLIESGSLHRHLRAFSEHKDLAAISKAMKVFGEDEYVWNPSPSSVSLIRLENFSHSGIMVNKRLLSLDESIHVNQDEDWIQNQHLILSDAIYAIDPEVGYHYRTVEKSRSRTDHHLRFESHNARKAKYLQLLNTTLVSPIFLKEIFYNSSGHSQSNAIFNHFEIWLRQKFQGRFIWRLVRFVGINVQRFFKI